MWPFNRKKTPAQPAARYRFGSRGFTAARVDILSSSWTASTQSIDSDLRQSLNILRGRSRDLFLNNDYAKRFGEMCKENLVGPYGFKRGIRIYEEDPKTGKTKLDLLASKAIETAFWEWSKAGACEITGKLSFYDIQNLICFTLARDGEFLARKIYGSSASNKFNFAIQPLDIDRLDTDRNESNLPDGAYIKMGVECSKYGRPVAYHLLTQHPSDFTYATYSGRKYERVPAAEIIHLFITDRAEQTRGVPWMHAAMGRLQHLGKYEEAAIIAARVGASQMGFFKSPDGDVQPLSDDQTADGEFVQDADPGTFKVLPPGYDLANFNPNYPAAMYAPFINACVRGISTGINVSYAGLSNDLEGVNFSSIRSGVLSEREGWMKLQNWLIEQFFEKLFSEWLQWALTSKAVVMTNGSALPLAKFDKFNQCVWRGRRWQWVDPLKDMQANIEAINSKLRSRTSVMADMGYDIEDVLAEIQTEAELAKMFGILFDPPPPQPAGASSKPADAAANDQVDNTQ